ncbi:MAG: ParE toxin of type toxin-antitoxin system, parDE [Pseudomonadota bacterium]|jgi:plasmid stabilization system protein ParE
MADMLEVQFTFQACEDLAAIWDSVAADAGAWHAAPAVNQAAADTLVTRLKHQIEILAANPEVGQERDDLLHGLKSSSLGGYTLFYRVRGQAIEVLRMLVQPAGLS